MVYDVLQWLQLYSLLCGLMALSNIGMRLRCMFNCLLALIAIASSLRVFVSMPLDTKCWMRACSTALFASTSLLACARRGRVRSDASTIIFSVILLISITLPRSLVLAIKANPSSSIYILSQIFTQKSRTILLLFDTDSRIIPQSFRVLEQTNIHHRHHVIPPREYHPV
jgi:hypothetical protein